MSRPSFWSVALFVGAAIWPFPGSSDRGEKFTPVHQLTGIGAGRSDMSDDLLAERTRRMIDSQTFAILRDPRALAGAARIYSAKMQRIFHDAERKSGLPASLISAVSYLESWGDSSAQSPTGPKGAMQISAATAHSMGLRMIYATHYKVTLEKKQVRTRKGKLVTRTVKTRTPYTVLVRDERLVPERAIPAAAAYLSRLESRFGGLDWAIFAYHCGEGCVTSMLALTEEAKGIKPPYTVAKMFFAANPAVNRPLYEAIQREMDRDFSPTYWFRIMRAQQLLNMYKEDPSEFKELVADYRWEKDPNQRAPHRLALWLKAKDFQFLSCDDLKREQGHKLAKVFDDPDFFGFQLMKDEIGALDPPNAEYYLQASQPAIGTLVYVAYETRRLWEEMKPKGEKYVPLEVTSLVRPLDYMERTTSTPRTEEIAHCSGQVFDINDRGLPLGEREALEFVLHDMGWEGYLGFVEDSPNSGTLHIGCAPSAREFFTQVFDEAVAATK